MPNHILLLGCYEHTITIARSLARAGHTVTLGVNPTHEDQRFVETSRYISSTWHHPDLLEQPAQFDGALVRYLHDHANIDTLFPVGEDEIRRVAQVRASLSQKLIIVMPSNDVVERCLNKESSNRIAKECGVPTAELRTVRTTRELLSAVDDLGLPVIAKPAESTDLLLNKKCVFIQNYHDLEAISQNWPSARFDIIVQKEIRGIRHNCDVVAKNGTIERYFESEILRTDQLDYAGNSVRDRSIPPNSYHRGYCERMVAHLNYTGLALFQFMRDPEAEVSSFLEINPRSGAAISLAVGCGMELPAAAVSVFSNASIVCSRDYPKYRTRFCLHDDLRGIRKARANGEIDNRQTIDWIATLCRNAYSADFFSTFIWQDIKPTVKIFWDMLGRVGSGRPATTRSSGRTTDSKRPVFVRERISSNTPKGALR